MEAPEEHHQRATGVRASELCRIQLKDLDYLINTLRVIGKGGKCREIPLPPDLVDLIKEYIRSDQISRRIDIGTLLSSFSANDPRRCTKTRSTHCWKAWRSSSASSCTRTNYATPSVLDCSREVCHSQWKAS